jgi:hypothetical protein
VLVGLGRLLLVIAIRLGLLLALALGKSSKNVAAHGLGAMPMQAAG